MPTEQKAAQIEDIASKLDRAELAILTDYRGLTVTELQGLRATLRPFDAQFFVAKNTLTRIAADQIGIEGLTPSLEGPLGLVLAYGDVVGPSKAVSDFARSSRILTVKGGVLNKQFIPSSDIEALASLPSKQELQAKLVGMLVSPLVRTVGVLGGPSRSVAYLFNARSEQLGVETSAAAD